MPHNIITSLATYGSISAIVVALITTGVYKAKIDDQVKNTLEINNSLKIINNTTKTISDKLSIVDLNQINLGDDFNLFCKESKTDRINLRESQNLIAIKVGRIEIIADKNGAIAEDSNKLLLQHIMASGANDSNARVERKIISQKQ